MEPRAYQSGAAGTPPALPSELSFGRPRASAAGMPATVPGPYWFFMIGEEVRKVEVEGGQAPDPYDTHQLLPAIVSIIAREQRR
jgi:hypothetical protein